MRKVLILFIAVLLVSTIPLNDSKTVSSTTNIVEGVALTYHNPISIRDNDDFTYNNGVLYGNGTEIDPYVIEGWEISSDDTNPISIFHTSLHLVIRNCTISYYTSSVFSTGIRLTNATNITLINNNILDYADNGIHLNDVENIGIYNNQIARNKNGIFIRGDSGQITINNNIFDNNTLNAIRLSNVLELSMSNNIFYNCGIYLEWIEDTSAIQYNLDDSNIINGKKLYCLVNRNNETIPDLAGQIILINSTRISIEHQDIRNASIAVTLIYSSYNRIDNNTIQYNENNGIMLYRSFQNDIINNTINGNGDGIKFTGYSENNRIFNNSIEYNEENGISTDLLCNYQNIDGNLIANNMGDGIELGCSLFCTINDNNISYNDGNGIALIYGSSNNMITDNVVQYNFLYGILIERDSAENTIINNEFIHNNNDGAQTLDRDGNSNWGEEKTSDLTYYYIIIALISLLFVAILVFRIRKAKAKKKR